jgi:hypothetical protein
MVTALLSSIFFASECNMMIRPQISVHKQGLCGGDIGHAEYSFKITGAEDWEVSVTRTIFFVAILVLVRENVMLQHCMLLFTSFSNSLLKQEACGNCAEGCKCIISFPIKDTVNTKVEAVTRSWRKCVKHFAELVEV